MAPPLNQYIKNEATTFKDGCLIFTLASLSLSMLFLTTYQSYSSVILLKTQCFSALYISLNVTYSNALVLLLLRSFVSERRKLALLLLSFHQEHRLRQLPLLIRAYIILLLLHEGIRYNRQLRRYLFTINDIEVTFFIHFRQVTCI